MNESKFFLGCQALQVLEEVFSALENYAHCRAGWVVNRYGVSSSLTSTGLEGWCCDCHLSG